MINIDLMSRTPIYEQVYNKIVELILKGILHENDQIPSVRSLAKELGVNPNTVAKAYGELERDGIIYSLSGRGSFISAVKADVIIGYALQDFDSSVKEALKAGLTPPELKNRVDYISNHETEAKGND